MGGRRLHWPGTALLSGLAALTSWVTLLAWTGFAERSSSYLVPLFGACLLVAVSGMLLRTTRLPALLVLLGQVAVLALWLHHRWAGEAAWGGWVPTADSLQQLVATVRDSAAAATRYAAPVPKSVTTFAPLMVLLGSAVALLVDLLACGLRRAPLAGLPLLAVYTAPVSILDGGVSWLKFALAAVSFLFLIAGDEAQRLGRWGQQLSSGSQLFDSQATSVRTQAVWSSARKIGLTATGLAVIVPIFVPTFSGNIFDGHGNGPGGNGDLVNLTNPIVDMRRDLSRGADIEVVRVTTNDPDPSYLRLSVLDDFDGKTWRPSTRDLPVAQRADGRVPRPPGLDPGVPAPRSSWTIATSDAFDSTWLPAPYPVYSIQAPGDWRYDRSTLDFLSAARNQTAAGIGYRLRGLDVTPTAADLLNAGPAPASIFGPMTRLPGDLPASVRELARTVTAGAGTKFEMAVKLQRWFRVDGGFRYSLRRASGNGVDELVHFLGTDKGSRVGYCEQFAAAMAVMGRSLKIPSRVAVGFLHPTPTGPPNTFVYSTHDLHAWPEMYFEGVGWVRFEPTPQSRTGAVPSYTRVGSVTQAPTPSESLTSALPTRNRIDQPSTGPAAAGGGGAGSGGLGGRSLGVLLGALVALVALLLPRLARAWVRRRRWAFASGPAQRAEAGWAELRDSALDLGLPWDDSVTVRRRAHQLVRSFGHPDAEPDAFARAPLRGPAANPEASAALDRLVTRVERARYARGASAPAGTLEEVRHDTGLCVDALRAGSSRHHRTRGTWFPASLRATFLAGLRRTRAARAGMAEPGVDHAY